MTLFPLKIPPELDGRGPGQPIQKTHAKVKYDMRGRAGRSGNARPAEYRAGVTIGQREPHGVTRHPLGDPSKRRAAEIIRGAILDSKSSTHVAPPKCGQAGQRTQDVNRIQPMRHRRGARVGFHGAKPTRQPTTVGCRLGISRPDSLRFRYNFILNATLTLPSNNRGVLKLQDYRRTRGWTTIVGIFGDGGMIHINPS